MRDELRGFPAPIHRPSRGTDYLAAVAPLRMQAHGVVLSFLSTTMVFGTPVDITLSELAIESFFPADAATAEAMRRIAS